jgi:hypothetical protein
MSENTTNNKNVSNDEIDLLDLFRRMGSTLNRWVKSLGRAFLISIVFLLKNWLPLGLSIIAGVGISFIFKFNSESLYTTDLVLRNNLPARITTDLVAHMNKLHQYSLENNKEALSEALVLDSESINSLVDISAFWIIDMRRDGNPDFVDYKNKFDLFDTSSVMMLDRLDIRVISKTNQNLFLLRDGLLRYINNDSLFQQRNRLRLKQNSEMIRRLYYDIVLLDSLQKIKYFVETKYIKPQAGGQMIFLQEQKTQLIYTDIQTLYRDKQDLEYVQELFNGITTILSDFSAPSIRLNGFVYYGKVIIPLCFGLVLLILIILANIKKLREVYNKY